MAGVKVTPFAIMPYAVSEPAAANRSPSLTDLEPTLYQPSVSTAATTATTDADGRFRITGLGADRTVVIHFDSLRVAQMPVQVITRDQVPPARIAYAGNRVYVGQQYYGTGRSFSPRAAVGRRDGPRCRHAPAAGGG